MGKSHSATNFHHLWRCSSLKETKSSLVSTINILRIINVCQDSIKHGKNGTDEWFYFLCGIIILWAKLCWNVWRAGRGFIATHETVHLVKLTGTGCSIFFCAYVTLLSTTGYIDNTSWKVLVYGINYARVVDVSEIEPVRTAND